MTTAPAAAVGASALLLTLSEVGDRLSLGVRTVQQLVYEGRLRSVQVGRSRRIAMVDLVEFVDFLREGGAGPTRLTVVGIRDVAPKEKARLRRNAREPEEAAGGTSTDQSAV